jgi:hypothetical protein
VHWSTWTPYREHWDHDHCAFCAAEISDRPVDDHTEYNAAWVTEDNNYDWICPVCFVDFREQFGWAVEGSAPTPQPIGTRGDRLGLMRSFLPGRSRTPTGVG